MPNFVKLLTVVLAMLFGSALDASAQSSTLDATAPPDQSISLDGDVSPEQLTELVARMSDDDLRAFVIEQLKCLTSAQ